jgi:hypothetical protein
MSMRENKCFMHATDVSLALVLKIVTTTKYRLDYVVMLIVIMLIVVMLIVIKLNIA